jgi:hypothetical protein
MIFAVTFMLHRIDDADRSADFGRNPELGAVTFELREARTRIDQHICNDLARLRVDEMRHVGRFRRVDEDLAVRTEAHAFRLDSDLHFTDAGAPLRIDDGDGMVVLVGHVQDLAGRILSKQLRIRTRWQCGDDLMGGWCRSFEWYRRLRRRPE